MIPRWQFEIEGNPFLNQHVSMPPGTTQAYTVQPYGASITPISVPIPSPLYGASNFGYAVIDHEPQLGAVTGWVWDHRKGVALGVVGVVGLAILGGLSAILR